MKTGGYILAAIGLMGLIVFLIMDNYAKSNPNEIFQTEDFFDTSNIHHEHIEVLLGGVMLLVLVMAYLSVV
jgi:hypothetical protein